MAEQIGQIHLLFSSLVFSLDCQPALVMQKCWYNGLHTLVFSPSVLSIFYAHITGIETDDVSSFVWRCDCGLCRWCSSGVQAWYVDGN